MYLIVGVVTVYNVLTLGYCLGELLSQVVLTKNTTTSRTFVCRCSDAAICTADKWKDLLAECRQMTLNIEHETTTSPQETTTSPEETTTSTTTLAQETTTLTQTTTNTASCFYDCTGLGNGHYQSCERCNGYLECVHGRTHERLCPSSTVWNDNKKNCLFPPSPTCVINA